MSPSKQMKLHLKCVDALDIIIKAKLYAENARADLRTYDNEKTIFEPLHLFNTREDMELRILKWDNEVVRLTHRYCNLMEQIVNPIMNYEPTKIPANAL